MFKPQHTPPKHESKYTKKDYDIYEAVGNEALIFYLVILRNTQTFRYSNGIGERYIVFRQGLIYVQDTLQGMPKATPRLGDLVMSSQDSVHSCTCG